MSEHDTATSEAPAPKKDAGFLSSIDGTLLTRFGAIAVLTSLLLGGLVFMSMRSLSSSAGDAANVDALADQISSTSTRILMFIGIALVVSLAVAFALSRATAKRVVAPMVQLRDAARATSGSLPAFVEACEAGNGVPSLPTVEVPAGGIASDIAASFNEMQRNAANLAVTQSFRRTRDGGRFVDLGRSTEQLLNDQMRFIEAMEHDETSAANLQRLFRIDHLASRMRRNAASMLVLADRDTPRQFSRPVPMHQVVQAASSGIEHFERVAMDDLSSVAVNGSIAADLAHLLAEVLETSTTGTDEASTDVAGQQTSDGFALTITDPGSALGPAELAVINQCLLDPGVADANPTTAMTHAVIARLAKRHGVRVELQAGANGGVVTQIHLPQIALARMTGAEATPATPSPERSELPAAVPAPPGVPAEVAPSNEIADPGVSSPPVADIVDRVDESIVAAPSDHENWLAPDDAAASTENPADVLAEAGFAAAALAPAPQAESPLAEPDMP